jgi:hypothetical protein
MTRERRFVPSTILLIRHLPQVIATPKGSPMTTKSSQGSDIPMAIALQCMLITPYTFTAVLIPKYGLLPSLGVIMTSGAAMLFAICTGKWLVRRRVEMQPSMLKGPSIILLGLSVLLSMANWALIFASLKYAGATMTITASLGTAVAKLWLAQYVLHAAKHKARDIPTLAVATVFTVLAVVLVVKTKIISEFANGDIEWLNLTGSLVGMVAVGATNTIVSTMLTDSDEAKLRGRRPLYVDTLILIDLIVVAVAIMCANFYVDECAAMLRMLPSTADLTTWQTDHWIILWVGPVITGIVSVKLEKINNKIGVALATTVGQARPILAELMGFALGTNALNPAAMVDIVVACVLLLSSAWLLIQKSEEKPEPADAIPA